MASIFTYDPDPPRVSSPWLQTRGEDGDLLQDMGGQDLPPATKAHVSSADDGEATHRITRLQAEPQEGPVEYKLHLLLRPRRKFRSTTTGSYISGSRHSKADGSPTLTTALCVVSDPLANASASSTASSPTQGITQQTRQHRLEQLTTQLLWRLQQSSPHHASSATNIILPSLPEALPELQAPQQPAKLPHGLEESQGALYEIGVSDDGTLVGLAEDELQESLNNLRAMAACLGCSVAVLRKETVGECEWVEETTLNHKERRVRRSGTLVVAEALIKPVLQARSPKLTANEPKSTAITASPRLNMSTPNTDQLRITLTGPTMSGKSTLLGTLTTSTRDNGRGKSRLSMLRHRHEITSGVTSSVTQELLAYQDMPDGNINVINYAAENVGSWIDVHNGAAAGRLILISDSAGHPRYRRTTIRGLVGWAPHWTFLCVPADDGEDPSPRFLSGTPPLQSHLGAPVADMDLSGAQLDLCLRLNLPLVVVITKLDLASRSGLKNSLSKVLDALKAAGRKPAIIPNIPGVVGDGELQMIPSEIVEAAYNISLPLLNDRTGAVPIVLTSAVQGTGIQNLHALIHELPMPDLPLVNDSGFVFHVEDVYSKPAEMSSIIISGRLRSGQISVGIHGSLGPFSSHDHHEDSEHSDGPTRRRSSAGLPTSRSFPGAHPHLKPYFFPLPNQEWKNVKVTSIRNLRLPVHTLFQDQVGTLAIAPTETLMPPGTNSPSNHSLSRIRKGMVLVAIQPIASRSFVARLKREDLESLAVGNHVVVYSASVRASARIVSARAPDSPATDGPPYRGTASSNNAFAFDDIAESLLDGNARDKVAGQITASELLVTFRWESTKEYLVLGDAVLVMPGGGPGLYGGHERGEKGIAGLEGFVGEIVQVIG